MTLATFLIGASVVFGIEASIQFLAACADGRSVIVRFAGIVCGLLYVGMAWGAVHFAVGIP
jgi:hypothetical protein